LGRSLRCGREEVLAMKTRRDFLRATLVVAGALIVPACTDETTAPPPARTLTDGSAFFPQSVASGDPRPDSVILWTRVEDPDASAADAPLEFEVATDPDFKQLVMLDEAQAKITALSKYDHCVKVKLTGLDAAKVYYYRFIYAKGGKYYVSPAGRTKTAPAANADVAVKFAFVSCQDYIGRFYNTYLAMAEEDLDFFVHLGDYVYETTGDPSFQSQEGRKITFTDDAGAIVVGEGATAYKAASSLDNYRQLYRTYRTDKALQAVHAKFPMIATWDDHEYSNDCNGAEATYFDGKKDETDPARLKHAHQAWFEYMPVDYPDQGFQYDDSKPFPGDIRIYRDFVFGKHVHLVMTDLRSYRPHNIIPADAFPGAVVLDQQRLTAMLGKVPDAAGPYVDIDTYQGGLYKQVLTQAASTAGYDANKVAGKISVFFINNVVTAVNKALPANMQVPLIDDAAQATLERGIAYLHCGKTSFYSSLGSRYLAVKDAFDLVAQAAYEADKKSQDVLGPDQESWFLSTMQGSKATWKVWGNEYCLTQIAVDLRMLPVPDNFKQRFYINIEGWDGFRDKRDELIGKLADVGGVVAVTGDIHAFFAGTPLARGSMTKKIVEFVGGSVTSATFVSLLLGQIKSDPTLSMVTGVELLAMGIDALMMDTTTKINPQQGFGDSKSNGYVVVTADGTALEARYNTILEVEVTTDWSSSLSDLMLRFKRFRFKTVAGESGELYQDMSGKDMSGDWKKWDPAQMAWV
jgi:alkaline phosphatase D